MQNATSEQRSSVDDGALRWKRSWSLAGDRPLLSRTLPTGALLERRSCILTGDKDHVTSSRIWMRGTNDDRERREARRACVGEGSPFPPGHALVRGHVRRSAPRLRLLRRSSLGHMNGHSSIDEHFLKGTPTPRNAGFEKPPDRRLQNTQALV